jgi:hypothetical protein
MRIIESRSIDNQAGLLGSRLITGTNVIEGAFQSFIVAEDTVVTKVYNSIGIDVTGRLGLTSITLKAGAFISMPKNDYFSSIKLTSGSVVAYFVSHGGMTITAQAYLNEFLARVGSSYLEAEDCVKNHLQQLINIGLLQKASLVMSPSMYEEDLVKSVVPQDGSGDLSFTRASNGTRINSAGLVEVCPWNLLEQSETFNTTWGANNLTVTANTTTAPNGTTTADTFTLTASVDSSVYQAVNGESNNYTISVYAKYVSGDKYLYFFSPLNSQGEKVWFDIQNGTVSNQLSGFTGTIEDAGNGWYKCSMYNTTAAVLDYLQMGISTTNSSRTLSNNSVSYFWGAQVNTGALKPYFPTTDRLNVPRLTYQNGGGGCPSLLLEPQRTNYITYSEQFDNAAWTKNGVSVTANDTTSPDGTQNADKLTSNDPSGSVYRIYEANAIPSDSVCSVSVYFKYDNWQYAFIVGDNYSGAGKFVVFDLINGTNTFVSSGYTATISSVGSGWYKCTMTGEMGITAYCQFGLAPTSTAYNNISIANGKNLYVWGTQREVSSYPTSYIPTTSSSATRVADACYKTGISSLIGQTEGTMFADFVRTQSTSSDAFWFNITDNSVNNWIFFGLENTGGRFYVRASNTVIVEHYPAISLGRHKLAIGYKSGSIVGYVDGVQVFTSSSTFTIGSLTGISLGPQSAVLSTDVVTSGQVNQAILFPTRLTNAELASITTI